VRIRAMNKPRDILDEWVVEAREVFGGITVMNSVPLVAVRTTKITAKKKNQPHIKKAKRKSQHKNQEILI
jgi:hypothetical protein